MKARAVQALLGGAFVSVALAFVDWRAGLVSFGLLLWVDSWRSA